MIGCYMFNVPYRNIISRPFAAEMDGKTSCIDASALNHRNEAATYFITIGCIYAIMAVFSITINGLIIYAITFTRELNGTFYKILRSLCASDLITGVVLFPMLAILHLSFEEPNCMLLIICELIFHTVACASILSMLAITYDRYLRASKKHAYSLYMRKSKGYCIITAIWFASPIVGLLGTFVHQKFPAVFAIAIIITITYLYLVTLKKLKANEIQVVDNLTARVSVSFHQRGVKRSLRVIFVLVLALLVSWCPAISVSFIFNTNSRLHLSDHYFMATLQKFPLLSAVSSPFLYFFSNTTARHCFVAFFRKMMTRERRTNEVGNLSQRKTHS